jgi:hypothetical protein
MTRLPFDTFINQAVGKNRAHFASACRLLESMASRGRAEAGVFLLGLLTFYREDLDRLEQVAESLRFFPCAPSAHALLAELHRLRWSNTTRRYLNTVVETLRRFPTPLVLDGFNALAADPQQPPSARRRYRDLAEYISDAPIRDGV